MKKSLLVLLSPFFLFWLKKDLFGLKLLFLSESESLKIVLRENGFHPALCTHPSILFGERGKDETKAGGLLHVKVAYLKKCIKIGLLKDKKGRELMHELGMQSYYGNGVDFWFEESHSPFIPYTVPKAHKPKGRIAVYTVLTGDYDDVHEILYREDNVDYFLFTNNFSIQSKTWQVVLVKSDLDSVLLSREIKMMPHKYLGGEYETSIYIDANSVVYGEITELSHYLHGGKTLAVSKHSLRKCVKEEIDICVKLIGTDSTAAKMQYERYLQEGFKDDRPLLECGVLVRAHKDPKLQALMQAWFAEFKNGVRRDQFSLLPCISRLKFEDYVVMDGSVWHNQFNRIQRHKKK